MKFLLLAGALSLTSPLLAQAKSRTSTKRINVSQDVDNLGGNKALVEMATALDPNNRARIVQNRQVDRNLRLELNVNYGGVAGGDPYLRTQKVGVAGEFHFNPRWSLGVRYNDYGNQLTAEGDRVFQEARENNAHSRPGVVPDIDTPQNSVLGVLSWYPIYGKTNLMNLGIAQFDMYLLAGGGQMTLDSGTTSLATAGAGVGFWVSQHFSIRTELTYQNYKDRIFSGERNIHTVNGQIGIGLLL